MNVTLRCVQSLLQRSCVTDVSITYLPQLNAIRTAPQVKIILILLQYRTAVVGAETAIRTLRLTATQVQFTMKAALSLVSSPDLVGCPNRTYTTNTHCNKSGDDCDELV